MRTRRCASRGPSAARGATRRIRSSSGSRARRGARASATASSSLHGARRATRSPRGRRSRSRPGSAARAVTSAGARTRPARRSTSCRSGAGARRAPARRRSPRARDARVVNAVCAQCHSGPSPRLSDGTALRNSSEALDLAASPCTGIKCTDCHDPHRADARSRRARARSPRARSCHAQLADAAAARAHAGTRPRRRRAASTATCRSIVMGIDRFVRTHRICVADEPARARRRRTERVQPVSPRSLARVDASTRCARGWEVRATARRRRRHSRSASCGSRARSPALRVIAAQAYARSPLGRACCRARSAGSPIRSPYVRAWTKFAVDAT